jgi:hypothetical protein
MMKIDGTFDVVATQRREVFVNGIHALSIPAQAFDFITCELTGRKLELGPFGAFPDIPLAQSPSVGLNTKKGG